MTLNSVMAVILRYFSKFGYFSGVLRKSSCSLSHLLMSSCLLSSCCHDTAYHIVPCSGSNSLYVAASEHYTVITAHCPSSRTTTYSEMSILTEVIMTEMMVLLSCITPLGITICLPCFDTVGWASERASCL